jgi:hypothetical protein
MIELDCFVVILFGLKLVMCWDGNEIHVPDVLTFRFYLKENIRHRHSKDRYFNDV